MQDIERVEIMENSIGDTNMSIVLMGAKRNEIFCVSDSRSTNTADHSHEDCFKKIIKMKRRNMKPQFLTLLIIFPIYSQERSMQGREAVNDT